jgi:hypothetical protein
MLKKAELIMQEEQPSFEPVTVQEERPSFGPVTLQEKRPSFEHVTVKEEPSFNENILVKEEMFIHMKEEPENEDEKPLMSSALEESTLDDYDVERPAKLEEKTNEKIKLQGRYKHNPNMSRNSRCVRKQIRKAT